MANQIAEVDEETLKNFVLTKDAELETDVQTRLYGVKNQTNSGYARAGYKILRQFYSGDQWESNKQGNRNQRVYNYARTVIDNYVALLTPPEITYPSSDITDPIETIRASVIQKVLDSINKDNSFKNQFRLAALNDSLLGDAFVIGPYLKTENVRGEVKEVIAFNVPRRPEHIRVIWADDNFDEIYGFIIHQWIAKEKAKKLFAKEIAERNISLDTSTPPEGGVTIEPIQSNQMVELIQYYDDTYHQTLLNRQSIRFKKHNWGFVPLLYVPGNLHPYLPWGTSDIEDVLDPQLEYNEGVSMGRDILDLVGIPPIFTQGVRADALNPIEAGDTQVIDLGETGKIQPSPFTANPATSITYNQNRKADLKELSMVNDIFFGGQRLGRLSGRALSVLMQPINKKILARQERWTTALKRLYANTLHLIEIKYPKFKDLVQGKYDVDVFFEDTFVRSVIDEINKFNSKTQSLYTTMKNIGIENPDKEIARMKQELADPELAAEISRAPQLQLQLGQMANQPAQGEAGTPTSKPLLTEEENQPQGEGVVAAPGQASPTTASGAPNLNNFRG